MAELLERKGGRWGMWSRRPGSCCLAFSVDRGFGLGQSIVMVARWVSWGFVLVYGCVWW